MRLRSLLYTCVNVLSGQLMERTDFTDLEGSKDLSTLMKEYPNSFFNICSNKILVSV